MFQNYLKIAWRNLKRNKGYAFINIGGLAVGMAAFILIALFVKYELSFDRYHENADRIFRVIREREDTGGSERIAFIRNTLAPEIVENFPEVISAARVFRWHTGEKYFSFGNKGIYENLYYVDSEFFEIFSNPFLYGDPNTALKDPFSIVMSRRLAEKHFGNENPVGQILKIREGSRQYSFMITGVFENMPDNSHLVMDLIIPFENFMRTNPSSTSRTYFFLQEGVDKNILEQKLEKYILSHPSAQEGDLECKYTLQPLTAVHLHSQTREPAKYINHSDIKYVYIYSSIAFLILIIVCLNSMNLTAARSFQRYKEVGIRKVVGAGRRQIFRQFLSETLLITILALLVSIGLAALFLPVFNNMTGGKLGFDQMRNPVFSLVIAAVAVLTGIVGGGYPALYLSSFRPAHVLKGTLKKSKKGVLVRKILVILQFAIAIFIIISTLAIKHQVHFINNLDMGYDREQVLVMSNIKYHGEIRGNEERIKTELKRNPNITAVSCSADLPNYIISRGSLELRDHTTGKPIPFNVYTVDHDFIDLYGMKIVEGRNFSGPFRPDSVKEVLINQTAAKALGEESPIGKEFQFWGSQTGKIIGIIKDFHSLSLHHQIPPTFVVNYPAFNDHISIKINTGNIPATISFIKKTMKNISPNYQFDYHFFDELFDRDYRNEQMMGKIFGTFMLLSIGIACMGLIGIATFLTKQRTKEIGIRKVLGASVPSVTGLLSRDLTRCVLLANILAWPVAYLVLNKWLQNFAYRVNLGISLFILSGLAALLIALLTIGYQTIKAATANPVESLRYE